MATVNGFATKDNNTEADFDMELKTSQHTLSATSTEVIINRQLQPDRRKLKWRLYLSVLMMCLATMISFAGTTAIDTIQSSLNTDKGLGTASLAVKTASMVIQSLFLNSFCFQKLGLKGAMIVGVGLELLYTGANFYPRWWTLIPGALISGLGKPMERTAEATYLSRASRLYVDIVLDKPGAPSAVIKTRFFNFYYIFYMAARVVGNVASSLILGSGLKNFDLSRLKNANGTSDEEVDQFCGAHYCDQVANSSVLLKRPVGDGKSVVDEAKVYQLCGFALGSFAVAIAILHIFLVKLETIEETNKPSDASKAVVVPPVEEERDVDPETTVTTRPWRLLLDTVRQWKKLNQLLLLPLSFYNGMDNTFFFADFTKSFVTCPFGIQWVGFTAAWYGITSPLIVLLCSGFAKPSLRPIPFFFALGCHLGCGATMLYLTQFTLIKSFILSAVWGMGSGLWPYTLSAFYGIVFEDQPEAAYSNYWLFDSFGATVNYSWSYHLCTETKIYVLIILLSCSFVGYVVVEIRFRQKQRHNAQLTHSNKDDSITKL